MEGQTAQTATHSTPGVDYEITIQKDKEIEEIASG